MAGRQKLLRLRRLCVRGLRCTWGPRGQRLLISTPMLNIGDLHLGAGRKVRSTRATSAATGITVSNHPPGKHAWYGNAV